MLLANYTYIIIAFAVSLIFSLIGTPLVIQLCNKHRLYDEPGKRKMHKQAIPRLGGILFMPSLGMGVSIAMMAMYGNSQKEFEINVSTVFMVAGALIIYLIGILDDLNGMKATQKFFVQTVAALVFPLCNLMINNLHGLFGIYEIPIWVSYPLTVFVILLIVNAMNLIDGIDGLSSSLAIIILGTFAYLYYNLGFMLFCLICTSLAGAILAFFVYNFYGQIDKTKIFMGDTGSLFLGYVIAYMSIKFQMTNDNAGFIYREEALLISFTLIFLPCIDVIRVAIQRKLNGKDMFNADKSHIHHLIMQMGLSMHQTLLVILLLFLSLCLINYGLHVGGASLTTIALIDISIYFIFILAVGKLHTKAT